MLAKPFDHTHVKCLLKATRTSKYWKIDVQGVWPKKSESEPDFESDFEPDAESQVGPGIDKEFDYWVPVNVFARDENAPDCANTPALSFPFDARELAAFMLYGNGCLIAEYYGGWQNGPDSERLDALLPDNFSRRAVKEAFEAYREALKIVGPYPLELDAEAERARKAWWLANNEANEREGVFSSTPGTDESKIRRASAVASTAELESKMKATAGAARAAQEAWLAAMVRQLLRPAPIEEPATPAQITASEPYEATGKGRLALLRSLGGSARYSQGEWKFKGIAALVKREKADGRNRSAEKTIRGDLKEAAEDERQAKAAGFGSGLGQR